MRRTLALGAVLGAVLGLPWQAVSYAANQAAGIPFTPFTLFEWLIRSLPGDVITLGLELMIGALQTLQLGSTSRLGKGLEVLAALTLAEVALAVLAAGYVALRGRSRHAPAQWSGAILGLLLGALALGVEAGMARGRFAPGDGLWILGLALGWGFAVSVVWERAAAAIGAEAAPGRRGFLVQVGVGSAVLSALALGLGRLLGQPEELAVGPPIGGEPAPTELPPTSQAGFSPIAGTREEITPIADFYRVDINLLPPSPGDVASESAGRLAEVLRAQGEASLDIPGADYVLIVDGLVEETLKLGLDELRAMPSSQFYATLECISNRIGGDLISTTLFTGVPLKEVLGRAKLLPEAADIKFTCADGYTESLPIDWAMDERTLLCYAMGGRPLDPGHGFPLRLFTPDRFGMKNPKWIIRIEAVPEDYRGYWEQRGWSEDAWVTTTSVIDVAEAREGGKIDIGGIAYAGARGIQRVEVRVDEGEWVQAELNRPLSPLTWVLWRATLPAAAGRRTVTVRAVDGTGEAQTAEVSDPYPDGATGHHSTSVTAKG